MSLLKTDNAIIFSNTVRGISASLINALVCFGFTHFNLPDELKKFIIFFTTTNVLLIVLNWGLKDYSVKLFASEEDTKAVFSKLFSLRLGLFIILGVTLVFVPTELELLLWILAFTCFKIINNTVEAFATANNKNYLFAIIDIITFSLLSTLCLLHLHFSISTVFIVVTLAEAIKMILGVVLFFNDLSFQLINPFVFIEETVNYFLVAFFASLLSKVDFYISAIYLSSKMIANYHIYSSLIGLSQIIITAFFSRQMVNWFKTQDGYFIVNIKQFSLHTFLLSLLALPCFYFIMLYFYQFTISFSMLVLIFFNLFIYAFTLIEIYVNTHQNKHLTILKGVFISSLVNVGLSFLFIAYFNVLGAIIANIVSLLTLYLYFKFQNKFSNKNAT